MMLTGLETISLFSLRGRLTTTVMAEQCEQEGFQEAPQRHQPQQPFRAKHTECFRYFIYFHTSTAGGSLAKNMSRPKTKLLKDFINDTSASSWWRWARHPPSTGYTLIHTTQTQTHTHTLLHKSVPSTSMCIMKYGPFLWGLVTTCIGTLIS